MPRAEHAQTIVPMFRGVAQGEEDQLWLKRQSLGLSAYPLENQKSRALGLRDVRDSDVPGRRESRTLMTWA